MAAPGLLALPSEVLRMLWDRLGTQSGLEGDEQTQRSRVQHRHALRCTCKQLRDAVTPFITTLGVAFRRGDEGDDSPPWEETLQGALRQLAAFPAAATLRSLRWCYIEQGSGGAAAGYHSVSLPLLLPSFLLDARARLGSVERATLLGRLASDGRVHGMPPAINASVVYASGAMRVLCCDGMRLWLGCLCAAVLPCLRNLRALILYKEGLTLLLPAMHARSWATARSRAWWTPARSCRR